eukprot:TRINITY_DN49036_c0_g1_i1.p1 TRINITY_DN49036_c0_g1~~TRINITY_DN49036_c0_g1_i1.p1  ORF type:complete len:342 (+),score=84.83 TRINITY_DN49036_c0_g1_i1:85-1110(+)
MFEWCEGSKRLQGVLDKALELAGDPTLSRIAADEAAGRATEEARMLRILDVGCGTSELAKDLWENGRRRVHAIDVDPSAIAHMRQAHKGCNGLTYQLLDITAEEARRGDALEAEAYDFVVDKGTLDYLICSGAETVVDALTAVHRALAPNGVLLVISIHPLPLLRRYLASADESGSLLGFDELQGWSLPAVAALSMANHGHIAAEEASSASHPTGALALRCVRHLPNWSLEEARRRAVDAVTAAMDEHFGAACPMLTAQREQSLRAAFEQAALQAGLPPRDGASVRLPLEEAYKCMFPSSTEREEYTLELFLEDLRADDALPDAVETLSTDDALGFLRRNQ